MALKQLLALACALLVAACAQAAPDTIELSNKAGAVTRTLVVGKFSVDKRGVPSFDYRFTLAGGACRYERHGRAVAGFDVNDGVVELETFYGQDASGKESPPITTYYDGKGADVTFEVTGERTKPPQLIAIDDALIPTAMAKNCGLGRKRNVVMFKNK